MKCGHGRVHVNKLLWILGHISLPREARFQLLSNYVILHHSMKIARDTEKKNFKLRNNYLICLKKSRCLFRMGVYMSFHRVCWIIATEKPVMLLSSEPSPDWGRSFPQQVHTRVTGNLSIFQQSENFWTVSPYYTIIHMAKYLKKKSQVTKHEKGNL